MINIGTATGVQTYLPEPLLDSDCVLNCAAHVVPDAWEMEGHTQCSGAVFRWLRDEFGAAELDMDEMLPQGALIIEWPERIQGILPGDRLWFLLEHVSDEHRRMFISAQGERFTDILTDLRQEIFGGD